MPSAVLPIRGGWRERERREVQHYNAGVRLHAHRRTAKYIDGNQKEDARVGNLHDYNCRLPTRATTSFPPLLSTSLAVGAAWHLGVGTSHGVVFARLDSLLQLCDRITGRLPVRPERLRYSQ